MDNTTSVETLKLTQLLTRWPDYSRENIYELSDQGYFGLYIKPYRKRKTYHDIEKYLEKLKEQEPENIYYKELMQYFIDFTTNHTFIIEYKPGYARLPSSAEVKIFPLCQTSSISFLNQYKRIEFYESNNTFGIVKENNRYFCNSFLLHASSLTGKWSEGYKGYFSEEDIFVFRDQIEHFESLMKNQTIINSEQPIAQELLSIPVEKAVTPAWVKQNQHKGNELPKFKTDQEIATLIYAGHTVFIPNVKGLKQIAFLVNNPNKDISSLQLMQMDNQIIIENDTENATELQQQGIATDPFQQGNNDPELDQKARSEIKARLQFLEEKITDAQDQGDIEAVERYKDEQDSILHVFQASTTHKKKSRQHKTPADKAREAVRQNILVALKRIKKVHPDLSKHLEVSLTTGMWCRYSPVLVLHNCESLSHSL